MLKANEKLKDARIGDLQDENKRLASELEKRGSAPAQILPVMYGNATVKSAFLEIAEPGRSVKLLGFPSEWSDIDLARVAAFMRLREVGLAKIESTSPNTSVVSGTAASASYASIVQNVKVTSPPKYSDTNFGPLQSPSPSDQQEPQSPPATKRGP